MDFRFLTNIDSLRQAAGFLEKVSLGVGGALVYQGFVDLKDVKHVPAGCAEIFLGAAVTSGLFVCAMAVTGYCYHKEAKK